MSSLPIELPRRTGSWTAGCVLVSNVIGAGVFTTTGFLARDLGDPALIMGLWLFGGLTALAGALSYSELGAALPMAGGEYVYLRQAYGPLVAFLSGWSSLTVGFSAAIAAGSVGFAAYFVEMFQFGTVSAHADKAFALILLWIVTAVHLTGSRSGGWLQRWLTGLNVGALLLFLMGAIVFGTGSWEHFTPDVRSTPGLGPIVVSFLFVSYAYCGWNAAVYIAGEVVEPGRAIPRSTIWGTLLVTLLYVAMNGVYFFALPIEVMAQPPLLPIAKKAAAALFGPMSAMVIAAILCLSMASAVSAMVWAGPRIYYAMASDGLLPSLFAATSRRTGSPQTSILLQSAWSSVLILSGTFEKLVIYGGVVLAILSALAVAAVVVLRRKKPELARPYRVPLYPWVPAFYILVSVILVIYSMIERPVISLLGLITILAGIPLYLVWTRQPRLRPQA